MKSFSDLYRDTKDVRHCLCELEQWSAVGSDHERLEWQRMRAKLRLVQHLHERIAALAERSEEALPQCKRLLDRLTLDDDATVVAACEHAGLDPRVIDSLSIHLGARVLQAALNALAQMPDVGQTMTGPKIFPPAPSVMEGGVFTAAVISRMLSALRDKDLAAAFGVLVEAEPGIPRSLQVPRMHRPLLHKYIGTVVDDYAKLKSPLDGLEKPSVNRAIERRLLALKYPNVPDSLVQELSVFQI
jgi:hypothetical protein